MMLQMVLSVIMAKEKELIQREVMAFGFHDGRYIWYYQYFCPQL